MSLIFTTMRNGLPISNQRHFQKHVLHKGKRTWTTPYGSSNDGLHGMHCSGQWIMSIAFILRGGLVCTSVLSTLCIVLRLACTSVLSTLCIVWYCHALMFLAHDVLFEISLTNFEALSIQVNALNSTCRPLTLTYNSNKLEILKIMLPVVGVKIDGDFFHINLIPKLGMMMMLVQRLT